MNYDNQAFRDYTSWNWYFKINFRKTISL